MPSRQTNAKLAEYVGVVVWNKTTTEGATIQTALDYAMSVPAGSDEQAYAAELYPNIAAVAAIYGDPSNKYTGFLVKATEAGYIKDASFFWNQPLSDSGLARSIPWSGGTASYSVGSATVWTGGPATLKPTPSTGANTTKLESAAGRLTLDLWRAYGMLYGACVLVMVASFVEFL